MSVEAQRLYVQGVDHLKKTIQDAVADMISSHQQLTSAVQHNNMLGVQSGIAVLQRYAIVLTGAARAVPPTPGEGSDFDVEVPYPSQDPPPITINLPPGVEDLSETGPTKEEERAKFIREAPEPSVASRGRKR